MCTRDWLLGNLLLIKPNNASKIKEKINMGAIAVTSSFATIRMIGRDVITAITTPFTHEAIFQLTYGIMIPSAIQCIKADEMEYQSILLITMGRMSTPPATTPVANANTIFFIFSIF
jgi:hypothetical protein